jgi:NADH:ubiquinone oxidoreductase subunit E
VRDGAGNVAWLNVRADDEPFPECAPSAIEGRGLLAEPLDLMVGDFNAGTEVAVALRWDAASRTLTGEWGDGGAGAIRTEVADGAFGYAGGPYVVWVSAGSCGGMETLGAASSAAAIHLSQPGADIPPDTTAPDLPLVTLVGDPARAHRVGSTLFYNPTAGGNVTLRAEPADAQSGISGVAFPAMFWDDDAVVAEDPYEHTYDWEGGATASGAKQVSASNYARLGTDDAFTLTPDGAAPSGAITGPAANATIGNGQAIAIDASDGAGAGVAVVEVRYCAGTSCTFAGGAAIGSDTTAPYEVTWSGQPADGQYTLVARATDRVGNVTESATVAVTVANDTTPPSAPVLTLSEDDSRAYVSGATLFYSSSGAGTFTLAATASDPESSIASITFPVVFGGDGATDTAAPYERAYPWASGETASGSKTVTTTNGAGLTASGNLTLTRDSTGPTISVSAPSNGATVANGQVVSLTPTDSGAGVALVEVRYCAGGSCAFAAGTAIGTDTSSPYAVTWDDQPADGQYTLVIRATDNVGNTRDVVRTVTVDNGLSGLAAPPPAPAATGQGVIRGADRDGAVCRAAARAESRKLGQLRNGAPVELLGEAVGEWQPVRCKDRTGYVRAELVTAAGDEAAPTPVPEPGDTDENPPPPAEPSDGDGDGNGQGADPKRPLGEVVAGEPAGGGKPYAVAKATASDDAPSPDPLLDGDPATVWRSEGTDEAWVALYLGKLRPVRAISWQVGPEGLRGALLVEATKDGKRWRVLGEVTSAEPGAWQTLRLRETIDARQLRLRFVGHDGATVLGGLAEVEVRGSTAGNDRHNGNNNRDRDRDRDPADKPRPPERKRQSRGRPPRRSPRP